MVDLYTQVSYIFQRKPMFVDTHCHLDCPPLLSRLDDVLAAAWNSNVTRIICPGVGYDGWESIAGLAKTRKAVFPAFGLHPMLAVAYREGLLEKLADYARDAVAIGEIGLDYALPDIPREQQRIAFRDQLRVAVENGRPVLVHCRKAFSDIIRIMKEENVQRVGGVMHAFSGSHEFAVECIRLGLSISVCGTVTYRNAVKPVEIVRKLPLEHILLETDSPDMTPEPYRGRDNEPAFLVEIARKVAEIKGIDVEEVGAVTTRNAERIFNFEK
jgi:TatD DNase family protein